MLNLKYFLNSDGSKIFISYRHEDSRGETGRLYADLKRHFRRSQIFKDTDALQPGEDFEEGIRNAVGSCDVLILVIGQRWLSGTDTEPRLNDPDDYVRLEITTAFKRGVPLIPVLVHGATMPPLESLPDELALLSKRQALEISDSRWDYDVGRLIKRLEVILPKQSILTNNFIVTAVCLLGLVVGILALTWNMGYIAHLFDSNNNINADNVNGATNVSNENVYTNSRNTNSSIQEPAGAETGNTRGVKIPSAGSRLKLDRGIFFTKYKGAFGPISSTNEDKINELLNFVEDDSEVTDLRWAAYMLATVMHETTGTWEPKIEPGDREYFDRYEPGTQIGAALGNTVAGDGYRYRGRGYVQIVGRGNYQKFSSILGLSANDDLTQYPDHALKPSISYRIMSIGMRTGLFTGKKLADYINAQSTDYKNARRIINGLDRADSIAEYAKKFEDVLRASSIQ
jgi:hypothetical protein